MNIWEFLGLPSDHRPEDKTVQLVRHHADVAKKVTYPRTCQVKKDGVFAIVVIDSLMGNCIFGRTGRALISLEHMLPSVTEHSTGRVAFLAELCCDSCSLEELSGIVNPNRKKPLTNQQQSYINNAYFAYHDMLYISELIAGKSERKYWLRQLDMARTFSGLMYLHGSIIDSLTCETEEEAEAFAQKCIEAGEEGSVDKDPEAGWIAGRKNEVATKRVKGVDFDLEVVGIEEGKGKHKGMVGKLIVRWREYGKVDGKVVLLPIDGCFAKVQRQHMFMYPGTVVGSIAHVHALCIGSKGALRIPKVKAVRIDKSVADL